jgi:hypothetical protein
MIFTFSRQHFTPLSQLNKSEEEVNPVDAKNYDICVKVCPTISFSNMVYYYNLFKALFPGEPLLLHDVMLKYLSMDFLATINNPCTFVPRFCTSTGFSIVEEALSPSINSFTFKNYWK